MLNRKTYFIREHVGFMKLSDTYDILDPETQEQLGIAKEKPGALVLLLRFLINKRLLPTRVFVYEGTDADDQSKLLFSIRRGFTLFRSRVNVCDPSGKVLGWFKSKLLSIGGAFRVFDSVGNE
ncbi:MAG: oxidoreductase, partial [Calditrichaeota bacterium]